MAKINLVNHTQARELFILNGWNYIDHQFIKVINEKEEIILANANEANASVHGTEIKINLGGRVYRIALAEFGEEVKVEWKDSEGLGAVLVLNEKPYLLSVYGIATKDQIAKIGNAYPELRIIDFGRPLNKLIQNLKCIASCSDLHTLNLDDCANLSDISLLPSFKKLKILYLDCFTDASQYGFITQCFQLEQLSQNSSELRSLEHLQGLSKLQVFNAGYNRNLNDLTGIREIGTLTFLRLSSCESLFDLGPLQGLTALTSLNLSSCKYLYDLSPLSGLNQLISLDLSKCIYLDDLSPLKGLNALTSLNLSSCESLTDLGPLQGLTALTSLNLNYCENLTDLGPLQGLTALTSLHLSWCENLRDLSWLSALPMLTNLDLSGSKKIVLVKPLVSLAKLSSLRVVECPNIRDFHLLSALPQLKILEWIDPLACSAVLMQCACNRNDASFIEENLKQWTEEIELSKDVNSFASKLLAALRHTAQNVQHVHLTPIARQLRSRGLQAEGRNDIDVYTWENWCALASGLALQAALDCLDAAITDPDIKRETEVLLGPVILAYAGLAEMHPQEKESLLQRVNKVLHLLEEFTEEQRQIAPSAAVFFAALKMPEQVLFWLDKATDAKAPLWREKVLFALVKYYAGKEDFNEARRLLEEMKIQDEKDMAIAVLAEQMAKKFPIDAGFVLDEIKDTHVSSTAARKLLNQAAMFTQPQAVYQLLLHLQETPEELANCLELIIRQDTTGKSADVFRNLFVQHAAAGPSASALLELCAHAAVADFVKPRALEKFKTHLAAKAVEENALAIPHFIAALKEHELIDDEEAKELNQLMQR